MRGPLYLILAVAAVIALPSSGGAEQIRAGADFQLNSYTTDVQRRPDVLIKKNGDFVVSWTGFNETLDSSDYGVFAQRFAANGARQGAEFRVNTHTESFQFRPIAAADRQGNFVVVWSSLDQDGDAYGVFGQRFAADGTRRGAEFQASTYITGGQGGSFYFVEQNQEAAMAPNGNFVVVWGSYYAAQDGSYGSVHGQRYDASGNRLGGEFQINTITTGYQFSPSVAMTPDNAFVVVWTTEDGAAYGIAGQRFDANGARVGGEFQVPVSTIGDQQFAVVRSRPTGEFTVTWTEYTGVANLFGRRFDANGSPVGAQFLVHTTADAYTYGFGMDQRGNFVVNWNIEPDGDGIGIGGRRFRSDGTPREAAFVVNGFTTGAQTEAAVASDEVGNAVSAWTDAARDGNLAGVFVQRFGGLRPASLNVDTAGNLVIEPGESADVRPSWRNINGGALTFGGALTSFTGPAGATYTITDATANYGTVGNTITGACTDCFAVSVSNPPTRPVQHWDASVVETLTPDIHGQQKEWALHVGASFSDVPTANPFYRFIETLLHNNVTGGCGGTAYCPSQQHVTRADGGLRARGQGRGGLRSARVHHARLQRRPRFQRVLPLDRGAGAPRGRLGVRRRQLLSDVRRHPRADVDLRAPHAGPGAVAAGLRHPRVRRRSRLQPVLPLDRGAGATVDRHGLRRRQLLPVQPRHARADGGVHQRHLRPDSVRPLNTVAIQGERGSFSHAAALVVLGEDARILPRASFDALFAAVVSGEADRGLLPIENSLAGSIHENYDRLEGSSLHIVGESQLRIRQCLIARPGASLASIRRVASHPVALAQCRRFFAERPQIEPIPAYDTAGSVQDLLRDGAASHAAIAGALAARLYGGQVLLEGIEDDPQNFTRFLVLAREPGPLGEARPRRRSSSPSRTRPESSTARWGRSRPAGWTSRRSSRARCAGGPGSTPSTSTSWAIRPARRGRPWTSWPAWPSTSVSWAPTRRACAPRRNSRKLHRAPPGATIRSRTQRRPRGRTCPPGSWSSTTTRASHARWWTSCPTTATISPARNRAKKPSRSSPRPPSTSCCSTSGSPASAGSRPARASASATGPRCPS